MGCQNFHPLPSCFFVEITGFEAIIAYSKADVSHGGHTYRQKPGHPDAYFFFCFLSPPILIYLCGQSSNRFPPPPKVSSPGTEIVSTVQCPQFGTCLGAHAGRKNSILESEKGCWCREECFSNCSSLLFAHMGTFSFKLF